MRQKWKKGAKEQARASRKQVTRGHIHPSISVTTLNINGLNTCNLKAQIIIQYMKSLTWRNHAMSGQGPKLENRRIMMSEYRE